MKAAFAAGVAGMACLFALPTLAADPIEDFYRGKSVTLIISTGVGGGYDAYGRPLSHHLAKHIPGHPDIIVQNMEGGGGLRAMNYLYSAAAKDGTVIGLVHSTIPYGPLLGLDAAKFDATKVNWIGSMNKEPSICIVWHSAAAKTFADLFTKEVIVGSVGAGADMEIYPLAMNHLFGTKFKVINGYKGGNDIFLAMERGEVEGRCGVAMTALRTVKPDWVATNKVNYVVETSIDRHPDPLLADTAMIIDHAKDAEQRAVLQLLFANQQADKPVLAPPEVPKERVAALRQALAETMRDPDFLAEMGASHMAINYVSGEAVQSFIAQIYASPASVRQAAMEAISEK